MNAKDRDLWRRMLIQSHSPGDWFLQEDGTSPSSERAAPGGPPVANEGFKMWVYRQSTDGWWEVGYYDPKGQWFRDSRWRSRDEARAQCSYLNGGASSGADDSDGLGRNASADHRPLAVPEDFGRAG
jgi:hypothetical protein